MPSEADDARLTAYALGELTGEERAAVESLLAHSEDARSEVADIEQASSVLREVLRSAPTAQLRPEQRAAVEAAADRLPMAGARSMPRWVIWAGLATAAAALAATALPPLFREAPVTPARDDTPSSTPALSVSAALREAPPEAHLADAASPGPPAGPRVTPLRTLSSVSFRNAGWFAWSQEACDQGGNVFFTVVPAAKQRHPSGGATPAERRMKMGDILGVSADGSKTTLYRPAVISAAAGAGDIKTISVALDTDGKLHVLVWAGIDRQYIVSFDKSGEHHSDVEVDGSEILASKLEIFGTGELLLRGSRTDAHGEPRFRMVVMDAAGRTFRDVTGPPVGASGRRRSSALSNLSDQMARAPDGRIYYTAEGESSVTVIGPSGESEAAFKLLPMPPDRRLIALKAAGPRLAAIYWQRGTTDYDWHYWIAVYDASLGERVAVYGPAQGLPVCYQYDGSEDRFTLFKNAKDLVTVAPAGGSMAAENPEPPRQGRR